MHTTSSRTHLLRTLFSPHHLLSLLIALTPVAALSAASKQDTLLVVLESGPNSLDIHGVGTNFQAYGLTWNVYDRLLTYGTKTLPDGQVSYDYTVLKGELAESWTLANDGLSVSFKLKPDAVFHDGTPVTAADVKWSFDRAVSVGGFPTFQMKAGSLEKPEQFSVIDPLTFKITFLRKDKMTMPDLAVPVPVVFNATLAKKHATDADPWAMEWLKTNTAASGAYMIESWKPGQMTIYNRHDAWKGGPMPKIARVIVREVPSAAARQALLERGDADISYNLQPKDADAIAKLGKFPVVGTPVENSMYYIGMAVKVPPFDNPKVRQAVAWAIPYEQIHGSVFYNMANKVWGADPAAFPAGPVWPQPFPYTTDLAKAKALLTEAGFPDGFDTTLSFDQGQASVTEPTTLLIQENLKKIGIRCTLDKIPGATFRAALLKKNLPIHLNRFGGWLNYPEYYFFWGYHGQGGKTALFNSMDYQNPQMDALIDAARFEGDLAKYAEQVQGFIALAAGDPARVPISQNWNILALQPHVKGYQHWFHLQLDFRQISKQ